MAEKTIEDGYEYGSLKLKQEILNTVKATVADFLYYDRKEDKDLPQGEIERAIEEGIITVEEIVFFFRVELERIQQRKAND